ncbi:MAG: cobalamin-binding protein [Gammaproteobacteria bacterium]|nr:cobalamin-binding protein [Gammaproteobacteria bacterium]
MRRLPVLVALAGAALVTACSPREPSASDKTVAGPARRIIALAPHLTELVYAAGAGTRLVGVVEFSDQPPEARALPRVGDAFRIDLEAIADARPDLILGWPSGNSPATLDRLRRLGYRVVGLEPVALTDPPDHIELIGALAGTDTVARQAADAWRQRLAALRQRYSGAAPVTVFYQISPQPLITVTGRHFIGQAITLCGGLNIFAGLPGLTAVINPEDVVAAAPGVIVANDYTRGPATPAAGSPLDAWRSWNGLPAVAAGRLVLMNPDLLSVPGPRFLDGVTVLCAAIAGA